MSCGAGASHSLLALKNGDVYGMGSDAVGQLGGACLSSDDEGESGERNRLVAGRLVGGPGDERCQAAAAAVRRHRGGGGKRGWLA